MKHILWTAAVLLVPALPAATLCVNPGKPNCFPTIAAAVSAAHSGDIVQIAHGTYKEDVIISISLSLVGENSANTMIDATGLANGVYINGLGDPTSGLGNPGISNVLVTGLTIVNANFEGILITNASNVTINANIVAGNDRSLDFASSTCPGIPAFETSEGEDCGEGIHLIAVNHSTISNNISANNSGGILISDETGPTHDNTISGNIVQNNVLDCGITIPSHPRAQQFLPGSPFGVYNNTVSGNQVTGNGLDGVGAGIGMFGFMPGATVTGNVITGNTISGNGLPGVAMHGHSGLEVLNNNQIIGNYISDNGADTADAATPGPAGINIYSHGTVTGTVISQNVIKKEAFDIVVNIASGTVMATQNNLNGNGAGVANLGLGTVDATSSWWGCASGPNMPGCSTVTTPGVLFSPWLSSPAVPNGKP